MDEGPTTVSEWEWSSDKIQINREFMNHLAINYLIVEGFKTAAEKFSKETKQKVEFDWDLIEIRI